MSIIAKIPRMKIKNGSHTVNIDTFKGIVGEEGAGTFSNIRVENGKFRTQRPLSIANPQVLPENITDISSLNGYMAVIAKESNKAACYLYNANSMIRVGASFGTYGDPANFCGKPIFTTDACTAIDGGTVREKMLYFPECSYNLYSATSGGSVATALPSGFPNLERATVIGGRLYGVSGQTVYVSGANGCFDWTFDGESSSEKDPNHAWKGRISSSTETQLPVTAIVGYKGSVLVFHKNAIQRISGNGNPYSVKDLFSVGAVSEKSIGIANGKLYFISSEGPMCFDGNTVKKLPALPGRAVLGEAGCTVDGQYCFYAKYRNQHCIYSYDPDSNSYGVTNVPGKITAFAQLYDWVYALINGNLYRFDTDRGNVLFGLTYPLCLEEMSVIRLRELVLRTTHLTSGSLQCYLLTGNDEGAYSRYRMIGETDTGGEMTFRLREKIPAVSTLRLELSGTGEMILERCRIKYDTVNIRHVQ